MQPVPLPAMGYGGPLLCHGAGGRLPPLPAWVAFALGRGARHWVPSPSRVPAGVGRAGHEGASPMGPRPRGQERWRRRGDGTGRGSCSLPSPVGVLRRGPIATGRNRLGRPGEAFCRSAGVEPGRGWCLGCPGVSPGPPQPGGHRRWVPAAGHCPRPPVTPCPCCGLWGTARLCFDPRGGLGAGFAPLL